MPVIAPSSEPPWVDQVLSFWFTEMTPAQWFKSDAAVDASICARFAAFRDEVAATFDVTAATSSARRSLATVIVLDQFPRNMFRATPRAFATDVHALAIARDAVALQLDRGLSLNEKLFLYLPFEHSEAMADQERAVALIGSLGNAEYLRYAEAHRDIISRFGRFPHRNAILGRSSTAEEMAFLQQPGSSF
jgi:uncharacterized protein (DUF924 family)